MDRGVCSLDFGAKYGFDNTWRFTGGMEGRVGSEGEEEDQKLVER